MRIYRIDRSDENLKVDGRHLAIALESEAERSHCQHPLPPYD
jgi:hypothetical protein